MAGIVGQLLLLVAFVATGLAGFAYFRDAQYQDPLNWKRIGNLSWGAMTVVLLAADAILIYLIATHQFQYAYVYQQSSMDLPVEYLFSASWAGQEGSFLLWTLLIGFVGLSLIKWGDRAYVAPAMAVIALCQVFLLSMIVGLHLGPLEIGASPFKMLAEQFPDAPVFQTNPDFVPADGSGLNDLLQNYWMVIHPPTLFVGFATMIVPFAFAVAALWKRRYTEWVRPALPWTLFSVMILGVGIAMGGYWAYETLSFGGYWAWDPVENSSLVPWIIGVAAVHMMLIQRKSGNGHKAALFLSILAFILVIYSTFLTRSGILGDISVHSFVDLGLYNQLLLWILSMAVIGFGLFAYRYKELPRPEEEPHYLSREFMIFSGAVLLCAIGAVVILGTSAPIFGRIFRDNPASVPIEFYNKWTLPLAVGFVFLAGLGQLFWWNKMSVENVNRVLMKPIALSVVCTLLILVFTPFVELTVTPPAAEPVARAAGLLGGFWETYGMGLLLLLLLFVGFFALFGNGMVLWRVGRGNLKMAGGALAHVGLALAILGIIASSGFSNPLSDAAPGENRQNFVIEKGQPRTIEGYSVEYAGTEPAERGRTRYVLRFTDPRGRDFTVKPVTYKSNKDQWIQHPDVHLFVEKDLFVAVSPRMMFEDGEPTGTEIRLARGDSTTLSDGSYRFHFLNFDTNVDLVERFREAGIDSANVEIAVAALMSVTNLTAQETREVRPVYIIMNDRSLRFLPARLDDWDLGVTFTAMNVNSGEITLALEGARVEPQDWVIVQAYEKPAISVLWIGILLLTGGFGLAIIRRTRETRWHRSTPA